MDDEGDCVGSAVAEGIELGDIDGILVGIAVVEGAALGDSVGCAEGAELASPDGPAENEGYCVGVFWTQSSMWK